MRIWLASGSPRRKTLLEAAGYRVDVHPAHIDESRRPGDDPVAHAVRLAREKSAKAPPERITVAADTVVHVDDRLLEKPIDRDHARAHLAALSGRWHRVTTGVCIRRGAQVSAFAVTTEVRFRALTRAEIDAYVATGEADDKAGAYGIQGLGGALVAELRGSWTNVMGLPLEETIEALRELGGEALEASRGYR